LSRRRLPFYVVTSFVAGILMVTLVPKLITWTVNRFIFPEERTEVARVTSPDGAVDAVMVRTNCGAACSFGYHVYVVSKGYGAPSDDAKSVFFADDMTDEKLVWLQPHLLEIVYGKALIYRFSNFCYPSEKLGEADRDYPIEIRLSPSSEGFSYLH
jgi:hypothetical protein